MATTQIPLTSGPSRTDLLRAASHPYRRAKHRMDIVIDRGSDFRRRGNRSRRRRFYSLGSSSVILLEGRGLHRELQLRSADWPVGAQDGCLRRPQA